MPLSLVVLICVVTASLAVAAYAYLADRSRQEIINRVVSDTVGTARSRVVRPASRWGALIGRTSAIVPEAWATNAKTESELVQAGYDDPMAPLAYGAIRIGLLIALPLLTALIAPKSSFNSYLLYIGAAALIAAMLPMWYLVRAVRLRQDRIRRGLPDALDLLVVCIEAGISLDAALLRVAKELGTVHPDLAEEFLVVNRKTNVGMPRSEALQGLWVRTGVQEVRALITHIIQGEKWGTSSGKVLRTYSETLRRTRRQAAEKKAATAPVKMLVPLALFIFPALLLVVLGPVILNVMTLFKHS